jgi:hypothetical protein
MAPTPFEHLTSHLRREGLPMRFKLLMVLAGFSVAITSVFTAVFIALKMWFD